MAVESVYAQSGVSTAQLAPSRLRVWEGVVLLHSGLHDGFDECFLFVLTVEADDSLRAL